MDPTHMLKIAPLIIVIVFHTVVCIHINKFPLLMPNVHPHRDELYLCTPIRLVPGKTFYIVGFEPNATMHTAHHMLLYGCTLPGSNQIYWNCGEMAHADENDVLETASPCKSGSHVIYAWARDAETLKLPNDVGFQVGHGTQIHYIVLQVHYSHTQRYKGGKTDNSGIFIQYTTKPRSKLAGILLLGTGGTIPPLSETHMETSCEITENKTIYPFAYRTHTHSLGRVVAGYKVHRKDNGDDDWVLLGKRDPLTPQMFYPVFNRTPICSGDKVAARCTMISNRTTFTNIGATNADEMCNFYLMYYVKKGAPLNMKYCFTSGPPYFYWNQPESNLNNIPDYEASIL